MDWKKDKSTLLLAILSFGLGLMLLLQQMGRLGAVQNAIVGLLVPVQYAVSRVTNDISGKFEALTHMQELEAQKKELEKTVAELSLRTVELEEAKIELALLREQLDFKEANPELQTLAAEVIGQDPSSLVRYLIIDRGARDGIQAGMPVISSRGLVGRISDVGTEWSKVLLLTDPSSSVNAIVQRSRATGIVVGRTGRSLLMRYISQGESVERDDIVITSGLGGSFPRQLVIGQVTQVHQSDVEMFQEAEIRSAVDFSRLEMVMVILNFTPIEFETE